jgi:hypothetical protein
MEFRNNQSSAAAPFMSRGEQMTPARAESVAPAKAKRPDPVAERLAGEMRVFDKVVDELTSKLNIHASHEERGKQAMQMATELFGVAPTWAAFYRQVLGAEGCVGRLFPTYEAQNEFQATEEYGQILQMLTALRSRDLPENDPTEPQRMVTIRMPKSLYDNLCVESNQLKISVNKLCISRITQRLDIDVVPVTEKKRRGRRPGSAGIDDQARTPQ